jgi:hypothetical protein
MAIPLLYYFPGNKKYPFGHVAIGVQADKEFAPVGYLSFGMGKGLATSKVTGAVTDGNNVYYEEYDIDFSLENKTYKGVHIIALPACSDEVMRNAVREFSQLDRSDYNFFTKNCANAVANFMKNIGCIPKDETFHLPVRPQTIAKRASELALKAIQEKRKEIKSSPDKPLQKIVRLIKNDIDRLQQQIKYDDIAHLLFKNKDTKEDKIKALVKLADLGYEAQLVNSTAAFEEFHNALVSAQSLSSKTANNIAECLRYFPKDLLSPDYLKKVVVKADDVGFYKQERKFILDDDELNELEMVRALIENDMARLQAQIQKDKTTFVGSYKSVEKKEDKISKLTALVLLLDEPVDYIATLKYLLNLTIEKQMKGETTDNLLQCVERFPYDRLPRIEEMRAALRTSDMLITEAEQKGQTFFSVKKVPDGIQDLRAALPKGGDVIEALEAKEVYSIFSRMEALLAAKVANKSGNKNAMLQVFYEDLNNLVAVIVTPPTGPNTPDSLRKNEM